MHRIAGPLWLFGALVLLVSLAAFLAGPTSRLVETSSALGALAGGLFVVLAVAQKAEDPWRTPWPWDRRAVLQGWAAGMGLSLLAGVVTALVTLSGLGGRPVVDPGLVWLLGGWLAAAAGGGLGSWRARSQRRAHAALAVLGVALPWLAVSLPLGARAGQGWAQVGVLVWGGLGFLAVSLWALAGPQSSRRAAAAVAAGAGVGVVLLYLLVSLAPYFRPPEERSGPQPGGVSLGMLLEGAGKP